MSSFNHRGLRSSRFNVIAVQCHRGSMSSRLNVIAAQCHRGLRWPLVQIEDAPVGDPFQAPRGPGLLQYLRQVVVPPLCDSQDCPEATLCSRPFGDSGHRPLDTALWTLSRGPSRHRYGATYKFALRGCSPRCARSPSSSAHPACQPSEAKTVPGGTRIAAKTLTMITSRQGRRNRLRKQVSGFPFPLVYDHAGQPSQDGVQSLHARSGVRANHAFTTNHPF
jgi:hypothetical protein